jgi:hypothetical protein
MNVGDGLGNRHNRPIAAIKLAFSSLLKVFIAPPVRIKIDLQPNLPLTRVLLRIALWTGDIESEDADCARK